MADRTRPAAWPGRGRFAAALAAGAVAATGQAPLEDWPLALLGLGVGFALIRAAAGWRQAAVLGWALGVGYFAVALHWIVAPFMVDAARDGWMAPFALVFLATGLALFWGAAAAGAWTLGGGALAWAVTTTLVEATRGHVLTGFPWALPAYVWLDTPVAQVVRLVGPYGLTFLTCLLAALLGRAALARTGRSATAALAAAVALGGGGWSLDTPAPVAAPDAPVIRIVQPDIAQRDKWNPALIPGHYRRQLDATAAPGTPALTVWPETALPWPLDRAGDALPRITAAAGGRPVALGAVRFDGARAYNSLAVLGPDGAVTALYDKHHLVPFGEYVPFGGVTRWLGLQSFAAGDGFGFSAGPGPQVLTVPGLGRVLPLICYEAIFPAATRVTPRPDWMLQVTNDAWFGTFAGPQRHLAQAQFRAIEQGLPLVPAANAGISAVIDARGHILSMLPLGAQGHLDAPLPPAAGPTPYGRSGDLPVLGAIGLALCGLLALRVTRRNAG